ncbi:hypothetical protein [Dictyobacter formicarum]|nr:hypothetical protein [Dictyobacter formicarum]
MVMNSSSFSFLRTCLTGNKAIDCASNAAQDRPSDADYCMQ